jgi:prepilin-type N-terminal cleavage/methylation domain-containing protein
MIMAGNFKRNIFDNQGFTLIELLVTITVISILSAMIFIMSGQEEKVSLLRKTVYLFSQDIREMQNMAMSAKGVSCGVNDVKVFGLHLDKSGSDWNNSYILFADCNGNNLYKPDPDNDILIRKITLKSDLKLSGVALAQGDIGNLLDITFQPPDPIIMINQATSSQEATITISLKSDPTKFKKIKINTVGRVQVE